MLDFPNTPTVGQLYPQPSVAGVPTYRWDGAKWTTQSIAVTGGKTPIYADGSNAMNGQLTLVAPPVNPTDAAAKSYVDAGNASQLNFAAQTLTAPQQAQATTNIAAVSYGSPQTLSGDTLPLTMGQRAQARSNIAAASFDALAYNGMQFNGSFEVSQERGPGTGVVLGASATTYICDGWTGYVGASGPAVTGQVTPVAGVVLGNVLVVNVTTAKPSLVAADLVCVSHPIEGYRVGRLNFGYSSAQPVTIGFWSGHHRPGAYCGSLTNGAGNRSYVFTYTHNVADGFQFNVVTIPGDITGTWAKDNTKGLQVTFTMAAGSAYQAAAANAWSAGNFYAVAPQVNGVAATTDVFRIYGVIVLPGLEAPSAARAPLIMRPYEQELLVCQRQLYVFQPGDGVTLYARNAQGDSYRCVSGHFPCQMRAAPTVTGTGLLNYAGGQLAATCAAYLNSWTVSYPGTLASDIFVIQNFKADARL